MLNPFSLFKIIKIKYKIKIWHKDFLTECFRFSAKFLKLCAIERKNTHHVRTFSQNQRIISSAAHKKQGNVRGIICSNALISGTRNYITVMHCNGNVRVMQKVTIFPTYSGSGKPKSFKKHLRCVFT